EVQPNSERQKLKFYSKEKLSYRFKMAPSNKMESGWFLNSLPEKDALVQHHKPTMSSGLLNS
ncbi:hypothetical protein STEG23_015702, partial [Scotinomys teguina]